MVGWREKLRPAVAAWDKVTMITLTIDRKRFEGPEQAYRHIQAKRSVFEFVKKLHRRGLVDTAEFFYAIEFHPSSPDWVHWHVAVRGFCTDIVEKWELDQNRFLGQHWLADLWGHGLVCVSTPPNQEVMLEDGELQTVRFDDPEYEAGGEHAMNYLTKYIGKQDVEAPNWVLDGNFRFRKFSTSRGLCGKIQSRKEAKYPRLAKQKKRTPREIRTSCAQEVKVLEVIRTSRLYMGGRDVKKKFRYKGTIAVPFAQLDSDTKVDILHNHRVPEPEEPKGYSKAELLEMAQPGLSQISHVLAVAPVYSPEQIAAGLAANEPIFEELGNAPDTLRSTSWRQASQRVDQMQMPRGAPVNGLSEPGGCLAYSDVS